MKRLTANLSVPVPRKRVIGFTATHGLENANKGPYFFWTNGKCNNALTINSWWHQNFIMEYVEAADVGT